MAAVSLPRRVPVIGAFVFWLGLAVVTIAAPGGWSVDFPATNGGPVVKAEAVPYRGGEIWVTLALSGVEPARAVFRAGDGRVLAARVLGFDPVTRLCFLRPEKIVAGAVPSWRDVCPVVAGVSLQAGGPVKMAGKAQQIGGKVLPLSLVKLELGVSRPRAGTPVKDASGAVVALFWQASGNDGYAIPVEAVHRVMRDVSGGVEIRRARLGLVLNAGSPRAEVVRVLPDSPAAEAGVSAGDVLQRVGARDVASYADAVNAFFYLIPGEPAACRLIRDGRPLDLKITPGREPGMR